MKGADGSSGTILTLVDGVTVAVENGKILRAGSNHLPLKVLSCHR